MAKTELKDLGNRVCVGSERNEHTIPALGNAAAIPGDLCAIDPANGRVVGSDVGALEQFQGILKESPITGTETAPGADVPCTLVVPKSGHRYRIRCDDLGATVKTGHGLKFGANAGKALKEATLLLAVLGRLSLEGLTGDTVCEMTWK
jgi:hypothetical protein